MPPSKHAVLSASGAHRWLHCNPSARLELEFADRETEAAAEGTAAHALAEHKLKKALKIRSRKPVSPYDCDEMDVHTDGYVEFVLEQLEEAKMLCADPLVLIEQRLDFSCYVPDGFGTGDCLIVADKLLHIIDFKYGQGVLVDAEENPQMMLYALGALRQFDHLYDITQVAMSIYQPRRENVSTWTITVEQLMDWAEHTLKPKAEMAYQGEGDYVPGPWCTFCKAAVKCRARAEAKLQLAKYVWGRRYRLDVQYSNVRNVVRISGGNLVLQVRRESTPLQRENILNEWYREQLKQKIPVVLEKYEKIVGVHCNEWKIKNMRTKWGTCNIEKKRIWLNLQLAKKSPQCLP